MRPALAAAQLVFGRGGRRIIAGIDLDCRAGRCYGLLGPNGAGKTTLLDLLGGVLRPDAGEVRLLDRPLTAWSLRARARVLALVPQDFAVRFDFTVAQVVEMGRYARCGRFHLLQEADRRVVRRVMEELRVWELRDRPVTRISGGERQRVAVARALAQEPSVLLLDEATSNLDIHHGLVILEAIRRRSAGQGLCVLAAMHDLNQAAWFCDELLVLDQGRIRAAGPTTEVLTSELIAQVYHVAARVRPGAAGNRLYVEFEGVL